MSLDTVIDTMRAHVANLSGLARVYDDPPESLSEYPCAIVYALRGNYEANAAGGRSFHTLVIEIHHSRQVLPDAMDAAKVWPDRMYAELKAATDVHIIWPMPYQLGGIAYANETHYGARFEIQCKVNES
jgi:hypothetical protein